LSKGEGTLPRGAWTARSNADGLASAFTNLRAGAAIDVAHMFHLEIRNQAFVTPPKSEFPACTIVYDSDADSKPFSVPFDCSPVWMCCPKDATANDKMELPEM
jgi:hypothetical protein